MYRDERLNEEGITQEQTNFFINIFKLEFPDMTEEDKQDPLTNLKIRIVINKDTKETKYLNLDEEFVCNEGFEL